MREKMKWTKLQTYSSQTENKSCSMLRSCKCKRRKWYHCIRKACQMMKRRSSERLRRKWRKNRSNWWRMRKRRRVWLMRKGQTLTRSTKISLLRISSLNLSRILNLKLPSLNKSRTNKINPLNKQIPNNPNNPPLTSANRTDAPYAIRHTIVLCKQTAITLSALSAFSNPF